MPLTTPVNETTAPVVGSYHVFNYLIKDYFILTYDTDRILFHFFPPDTGGKMAISASFGIMALLSANS